VSAAVVAIDMGYGHLRAAAPLAQALGTRVLQVDRSPLADEDEQKLWHRTRSMYEGVSRLSQLPVLGVALKRLLDEATFIPHLHPYRDLSAPTMGVRGLDTLIRRGLGRGLVEHLRKTGEPLVTTFFVPALVADLAGCERVYCVVTDTDINRMWAPLEPTRTKIHYFAPSARAQRRLRAYGVPAERIEVTGFPLPHELLGGPELRTASKNVAARLVRLDPEGQFRAQFRDELDHFLGKLPEEEERRPPLITFAVGGAGAQADLVRKFLPSFRFALDAGRLRLALVAGIRPEIAAKFREWLGEARVSHGVEILEANDHDTYFKRFNDLLARTDVLWTKPSEMTFFGALGLPLVFAPPVGVHERYNRRWARESGAGLKQREPRFAAEWFADWLADGTLAAAAWSGYMRLPKFGLYRILEALEGESRRARELRG
jgi:hypothetical protein